jgi:nitroimidazol reductase NimA-like FMN-containing flavoprotein (pyridoxamine 5'-phosphate oxidase superfamily)
MTEQETWSLVEKTLDHQKFGVLATLMGEYPYTSAVMFAAPPDAKYMVFATPRHTRKYVNLKKHPKASIFVNNAANRASDVSEAIGITALGDAAELFNTPENQQYFDVLRRKHPSMQEFIDSAATAIFMLKIHQYYVVRDFQQVYEFHVQDKKDDNS